MDKICKIKLLKSAKRKPSIIENNFENTLLPRQKKFISEYLIDLNGERAAIRAGYSRNSAAVQACRLLKKKSIRNTIEFEMNKWQRRIEIDQDKVIYDLEKTRQAAYVAGKYSAAVRCSELMGRHLGMFVDRQLLGNDVDHPFNIEEAQRECLETLQRMVPDYHEICDE